MNFAVVVANVGFVISVNSKVAGVLAAMLFFKVIVAVGDRVFMLASSLPASEIAVFDLSR